MWGEEGDHEYYIYIYSPEPEANLLFEGEHSINLGFLRFYITRFGSSGSSIFSEDCKGGHILSTSIEMRVDALGDHGHGSGLMTLHAV